jgi:hypothetical protein
MTLARACIELWSFISTTYRGYQRGEGIFSKDQAIQQHIKYQPLNDYYHDN